MFDVIGTFGLEDEVFTRDLKCQMYEDSKNGFKHAKNEVLRT